MKDVQIIILAGGKGTRMNHATLPKALVPFHGKPMIDYPMYAVEKSRVTTKPIVVVGYEKEQVMDHLGDRARYVIQEEQLGTGHAVKVAENSVSENTDTVLVLFADQPAVTSIMIDNLIAIHKKGTMPMTMATVTVPNFEDWYQVFYKPFSRIIRDENDVIIRSVEFKDATDEEKKICELNPVYFCFNKKWLLENLKKIKNENAQGEYYLPDLVKLAAEEGGIGSVSISPEQALGVNSLEELERLQNIIQKNKD